MQCSPYTCSWNTDTCWKPSRANSRATLYHIKNIFLFRHVLFTCPFRWNMSTGKRTAFTQCIEHLVKHSTIRNSARRKPSTVFFNSSSGTAIAAGTNLHHINQHIRHWWRCAAFFTTLQQCHYQQSQQPNDASHRFTCFRQWRSTVGGKDNTGRPSQVQSNAPISETVQKDRWHVEGSPFFFFYTIVW